MSRRANSVIFGFDFQENAAIVLMVENMAEMVSVKIEGEEDIEIRLNDGSTILAQAKSVVKASTDFSNVRTKAKAAMTSLSEAAEKVKVRNLIYYTNSPNPFNDEASKPMFYGKPHDRVNDRVNSTYQAIMANPGIQRKRISELTGKSIPTIDRHIALLAKSNLIEHRDSDKTGGYYAKK